MFSNIFDACLVIIIDIIFFMDSIQVLHDKTHHPCSCWSFFIDAKTTKHLLHIVFSPIHNIERWRIHSSTDFHFNIHTTMNMLNGKQFSTSHLNTASKSKQISHKLNGKHIKICYFGYLNSTTNVSFQFDTLVAFVIDLKWTTIQIQRHFIHKKLHFFIRKWPSGQYHLEFPELFFNFVFFF